MGEFTSRHRHSLVLALSGAILLGSGVSLGVGISELSKSSPPLQTSGFASVSEEEPASQSAGKPIANLININTASAAELETLPGVGPSKAAAIINYREENGPFRAVSEIQNVSGIGPATYAKLKGQITVE